MANMNVQQAAQILGVSMNVTEKELQKAYRRLCMKWHPDHNPGNETYATQMIQKINEAYQVMSEYVRNNARPNPNALFEAREKFRKAVEEWSYWQAQRENAAKIAQDALRRYGMINEQMQRLPDGPERDGWFQEYKKAYAEYNKYHALTKEFDKKVLSSYNYMLECANEYRRLQNAQKAPYDTKYYTYQRAA